MDADDYVQGSLAGLGLVAQFWLPDIFPSVQWATDAGGSWNVPRGAWNPFSSPMMSPYLFVDLTQPPWSSDPLVQLWNTSGRLLPLSIEMSGVVATPSVPQGDRGAWLVLPSDVPAGVTEVIGVPHCSCHLNPSLPCEFPVRPT